MVVQFLPNTLKKKLQQIPFNGNCFYFSVFTSQKSTENTIEEQSSDSTDQPATTNEVLTTDNNEEPLINKIDEVNDSDYKLKIDDPNDGYRGRDHIFFSHDNENVFGQLQIRDGLEEAGFAVCSAR
ncbi:hypothetical protein Avbf_09719 [Armadillidium vulgare]|nr:hypothetical protein Avbf_09719 [Armadillidium vulgare]